MWGGALSVNLSVTKVTSNNEWDDRGGYEGEGLVGGAE